MRFDTARAGRRAFPAFAGLAGLTVAVRAAFGADLLIMLTDTAAKATTAQELMIVPAATTAIWLATYVPRRADIIATDIPCVALVVAFSLETGLAIATETRALTAFIDRNAGAVIDATMLRGWIAGSLANAIVVAIRTRAAVCIGAAAIE